jgi:polysaccharide biosynthesis/export protein
MVRGLKAQIITTVSLLALASCASMNRPRNLEPIADGQGYQAQYRPPEVSRSQHAYLRTEMINEELCLPPIGSDRDALVGKWSKPGPNQLQDEKLSRNDLILVVLDNDEVFSGEFVISRDGMLKLPYLPPVKAQGRTALQVENELRKKLVAEQYYDTPPLVSIRVADFASVSVGVSGAVFEPHTVEIGGTPGDRVDSQRQRAVGSSTEGRNLSAALRAAGGIRPDADLSAVELHRDGKVHKIDLRGVFEGNNPADIMLLTGDQVIVKSRQCFQADLMRPSPISPPGISLYLSNLTQPATGNAISAISREVREVPYGTRYIQAVVDSNCVGGVKATSANRTAVLFSRNPITDVSVVIERNIEDLLRRADRDDYDPYLLPGDALACYDSSITNVAEVARVLGVVGAALLLAP